MRGHILLHQRLPLWVSSCSMSIALSSPSSLGELHRSITWPCRLASSLDNLHKKHWGEAKPHQKGTLVLTASPSA